MAVTEDESRLLIFEYRMALKQKIAYDSRAWQILIAFIALAPTALALTAQLKQPWMTIPPCLLLVFTAVVWWFAYERYRLHVEILSERLRDIERKLNGIKLTVDPEKYGDMLEDRTKIGYMKTELLVGYHLSLGKPIKFSNIGYGKKGGQQEINLPSAHWFARMYVAGVIVSSVFLVAVKFNLAILFLILLWFVALVVGACFLLQKLFTDNR